MEGLIEAANARLKADRVRVKLTLVGEALYLRAMLPPKPGSTSIEFSQQRIAMGKAVTARDIKTAEAEAHKIWMAL